MRETTYPVLIDTDVAIDYLRFITLTSIDCLIAATAIIKNYKIATRNKSHYPIKDILLEFDK